VVGALKLVWHPTATAARKLPGSLAVRGQYHSLPLLVLRR